VQADITRNRREFTALIRAAIFQFLRALREGRWSAAAAALVSPEAAAGAAPPWPAEALAPIMEAYYEGHERLSLDPEARQSGHTHIRVESEADCWQVDQVFVDPEGLNDWQARFRVDLPAARAAGRPVLVLEGIGPIGS
jgi:hypothetical protein